MVRLLAEGVARLLLRHPGSTTTVAQAAIRVAECRRQRELAAAEARSSRVSAPVGDGRLQTRPRAPTRSGGHGLRRLGLARGCDGLLYVPESYRPHTPAPLVLALHGAGSFSISGLEAFLPWADRYGLLLLAPDARGNTWDRVRDDFGPDVEFIDRALERVVDDYAVDPAHLAAEGFSDGASYALSLGLTNGDLFTHVIAFSPGFVASGNRRGNPRVFISHGTRDQVLPIGTCSRRIVPLLRAPGYDLTYHEFRGGHTIPPAVSQEALSWFLGAA